MKLLFCIFITTMAVTAEEKSPEEYFKEANEQFAIRFFNEVARQNPDRSTIQSAFSVLSPLALLAMASTGPTHDEILKTLGLPNDNVIKAAFANKHQNLKAVTGITLKMANKIYIGQNYELNDEFAAVTKDIFESEVQNIDFTNSNSAASEINGWVESHTNNLIKDIVDPNSLTEATAMVLVNAIYFKGNWKSKFHESNTLDRDFFITKDKKVKVPMMYQAGDFLYGESKELDAQLLELPYVGDDVSFVVILPKNIEDLPQLRSKIAEKSLLKNVYSQMRTQEVEVFLPKFKIETQTNLVTALENMNIKTLFSSGAELTKLIKGGENLYVSQAMQKALIEVNEEGTEAAAGNDAGIDNYIGYTGEILLANRPFYYGLKVIKPQEYILTGAFMEFGIQYLSALVRERYTFKADHPFMFYLKQGDNILFSGTYNS